MVVEPINPSAFQAATSLSSTYRNYRDALSSGTDFVDDISAAYTKNESPESPDFFDLELSLDGFSASTLEGNLTGDVPNSRDVTVTEGTITFSRSSGAGDLVATPYHDVRIQRNDENTVTVTNRTTDQAVRLEEGGSLTVSGEGQAELAAGGDRTLRLEDGESISLASRDDSLRLKRSTFRDSVDLTGESIQVTTRGEPGSEISLYTGPSESLQFGAGQEGTIEKTGNSSVRITNKRTGESMTIAPTDTLKAAGEAEFFIGEDASFEVEEGDTISLFGGEDGLEIRNQSVVGSVSLNESVGSPDYGSPATQLATGAPGGQTRVYGQLFNGSQSFLNLPENPPVLGERVDNSVGQVIETLSERDPEELIGRGITLGEDFENVPFRAERGISGSFELLPSILYENEESEGGPWNNVNLGQDEELYFFEDES